MRVLHVIPAVAQRYGGPSAAIGPMCRALMTLGVDPLVVTTDADGRQRLPVPIGEPTTWNGVPALFFRRNFSESLKYSRDLAQWLRTHVGGFDVVHIHAVLSHACLTAASASRRAGVPYVMRPLGTLAPWSLQQHWLRKRILLGLAGRQAIRSAAAVHCTSEREKRDLVQTLGSAHAVVIPLGIDPSCFEEPPLPIDQRERDPYALVLSRLHHKKNLEVVIDSFLDAATHHGGDHWRLVLAGTGSADYLEALHAAARKRGAENRVAFVGWVDGEQKRQLIRRASLFVLASLHENFGVSLLEALAAGVPSIVSDRVDLADAPGMADAGWIVSTDRTALSAAFGQAFGDSTRRDAMGRAARRLAEQYAWPGVASQLVALYGSFRPSFDRLNPTLLPSEQNAKRLIRRNET